MYNAKMVDSYCKSKEEEKQLSKKIKSLGADIKAYLIDKRDNKKGDSEIVGEWTVSLQHKVVEDVDMEKLANVLIQYWEKGDSNMPNPFIMYVPTVNMEALEKSIYAKEIPEDVLRQIDSCRIKKENDALVYTKTKKKKEEED